MILYEIEESFHIWIAMYVLFFRNKLICKMQNLITIICQILAWVKKQSHSKQPVSIYKCNRKAWIFTSITTVFLIQPDRPSMHAKCVTNWQEFVRGDQFTYERGREEDTRQARRKIRRSSGHAYVQILCTPSLKSLEY